MTTRKQVAANRKNALGSTGPKTPAGKARVAQNAVRHGLRSELPILLGERPEDWEAFRVGVFQSLAPVGTLEEALAERVALCSWRLRRVVTYETATTSLAIEEVAEEARRQADRLNRPFVGISEEYGRADRLCLATAEKELAEAQGTLELWDSPGRLLEELSGLVDSSRVNGGDACMVFKAFAAAAFERAEEGMDPPPHADDAFLISLGVPENALPDAGEWDGWTAATVRKGLEKIANAARIEPERLYDCALSRWHEGQTDRRANVEILEKKVGDLRSRIRAREDRLRQQRVLPDGDALDKVLRYETHLSRQMFQTHHELQRLQVSRAGTPATLPAALDVTVEGGSNTPAALGTAQEELLS
jgi:hypothetical protein